VAIIRAGAVVQERIARAIPGEIGDGYVAELLVGAEMRVARPAEEGADAP
jgi:hypothetical protein